VVGVETIRLEVKNKVIGAVFWSRG